MIKIHKILRLYTSMYKYVHAINILSRLKLGISVGKSISLSVGVWEISNLLGARRGSPGITARAPAE